MKTIAVMPLLGVLFAQAQAAAPDLPREGWASWEVAATDGAPFWCCWHNMNGQATTRTTCKLDDHKRGYGSIDKPPTDAVRVYAHTKGGKVNSLRVLAAACPVEAGSAIQELVDISADDSVRWLAARVRPGGRDSLGSDELLGQAVAAMALHSGDLAAKELAGFARHDARKEVRKWSVFWLAHTGAMKAEQVIRSALREDTDHDVREHAVFALSQLPGERATQALIAVAEDQSLSREQRKRAVFWLSQSESDAAQGYLEKVLARTDPK